MFREIQDGVKGHHTKPISMRMRMENGELANDDKINIKVFEKHLHHVYNHQRPRYPPMLLN